MNEWIEKGVSMLTLDDVLKLNPNDFKVDVNEKGELNEKD